MGFSCLFSLFVAAAPRLGLVFLWLFRPERVQSAFEGAVVPMLGLVFLPFATFAYILIAPKGVQGLDWLWLALAFLADVGVWAAGGYLGRRWPARTTGSQGE
jgi:hypothetical protein